MKLNGVTLTTPVFMPVWTNATIKWVPLDRMTKEFLWSKDDIRIILNNTFHLHLRPWEDIVQRAWGMHTFQKRDNLILTDSWGYQVYSLWVWKWWKSLVHIKNDAVHFASPHDGSKHIFTPTWVVDIQRKLWSDIMMMLDVCSSVENTTKKIVAKQMYLTHKRAKEQYTYHMEWYNDYRGVLFPIIQWWMYEDLRKESLHTLKEYAYDGIAIWWLSVWETREEMYHTLDILADELPSDIPRYLMWVWTPEDLLVAIEQWIDMFDCVMPTRLWRHWTAFSPYGSIKLKKQIYKDDFTPLDKTCRCYTCTHFTKAYLHHLIKAKEMMWWTLLSLHNIAFLHNLLEKVKQEVLNS